MDSEKIIAVIASIFLPPLAVLMKTGTLGASFWICCILCIFAWFPGILYALYVVLAD
ncbi:YqaE/Pmp3 family membrane protein [Acetobacter pasteurianus]|uniref:Plasma membrane proteolipid 3 n=1 Tax=Lodderomyces elongisporus (strain ATCC 11503 / CBS 2605 / JCM 1781 / NBRC 1676 / NRRL YB-4239) TaxID=379508 RepID=A5DZX8_LODEL|nr:predicted protein [Lodderomyces elongisporus NRRL YB-4239]MDC6272342.1 YqaE/Pmp3 family membrane protein [Acetobacter pasteurianus]